MTCLAKQCALLRDITVALGSSYLSGLPPPAMQLVDATVTLQRSSWVIAGNRTSIHTLITTQDRCWALRNLVLVDPC
jgi:hypothetical protein